MIMIVESLSSVTQVRDDELVELDRHHGDDCAVPATGGSENTQGKVNILLQSFISRGYIDSFSLVSDSAYVAQVSESRIIGFMTLMRSTVKFSGIFEGQM